MFLSAVSTKGAETFKPGDVDPVGDLSPATFRVELDEAILLKNADIELVSCKIAKENKIVLEEGATLSVRMGLPDVAEQYTAKVAAGTYTPENLADAIARALNYVMPWNAYKGWSASIVLDKIQLTYTIPPDPNTGQGDIFQDNIKDNLITRGINYPTSLMVNDGNFVKFECDPTQIENIHLGGLGLRAPTRVPTEEWAFCGAVDIGEPNSDDLNGSDSVVRQAMDNFGLWEGTGGKMEAILRPLRSVVKSTFDVGYDGFSGATGKPTYWTFEFGRYNDVDGNQITGEYEYGGMWTKYQTDNYNQPREYFNLRHKQINGCLNLVKNKNDFRGAPYNKSHKLYAPYPISNSAAIGNRPRLMNYRTGWSGCVEFSASPGAEPKNRPVNIPATYSFQMDNVALGAGDNKARCLAQRVDCDTDNVRMRPTQLPLIQGLPQQQAVNGDLVDTFCVIDPPAVVQPLGIEYIVGSVGQMNSPQFAADVFQPTSQQGLHTGGGAGKTDVFKLPWYKIVSINADGSPNRVVLSDSGEFIVEYDATDAATRLATTLWLNDPNTWKIKAGDPEGINANTEEETLNEQIYRVLPEPAHIGANVGLEQELELRYASFNMGFMRDNVFNSLQATDYGFIPYPGYKKATQGNNPLALVKDIEIDVYSILEDNAGNPIPNTGQIGVRIKQLQPSTAQDSENVGFDSEFDVQRVLLNTRSNIWSSQAGTGPAMSDWTTFVGVGSGLGAVKVNINWKDIYSQTVSISHCTNYVNTTSLFVENVILTSTGITRAGAVAKNECITKTRFAPFHPVFSHLPGTIAGINEARVFAQGSMYENRNLFYPDSGKSNLDYNYNANLAYMSKGVHQAPQNVFPAAPPSGTKPLIMIKTKKLDISQIVAGPVASGTTDQVIQEDFTPQNVGTLWNAGLFSVMYAQIPAGIATSVDFPTNAIPHKQAFMPSFTVEIQNLPLNGYIGKGFDEGKIQQRRGMGSRLPIVGVVPAEEFDNQLLDNIVNYFYKTPFSQPVQLRLPTKQPFYNLDFNLRNIVTGKLLRDLIHPSEVVIRIYPLPDNL